MKVPFLIWYTLFLNLITGPRADPGPGPGKRPALTMKHYITLVKIHMYRIASSVLIVSLKFFFSQILIHIYLLQAGATGNKKGVTIQNLVKL